MTSSQPVLLVVEDDPLVRMTLADALIDGGFEVLEAEMASEAMALLEARPDIVALLTDINLLGEVDGFSLAQAARGLRPNLPVLYASGRYMAVEEGRGVPGACFLAKPFMPSLAVDMLRALIGCVTPSTLARGAVAVHQHL